MWLSVALPPLGPIGWLVATAWDWGWLATTPISHEGGCKSPLGLMGWQPPAGHPQTPVEWLAAITWGWDWLATTPIPYEGDCKPPLWVFAPTPMGFLGCLAATL